MFKHGHSKNFGTPTYVTWLRMWNRCRNKNERNYKYYGGRGIVVCSRWKDYRNFLFDMGERPVGRTLDRINNDGNYGPENCRWATASEQLSNRRTVKIIEINGRKQTATAWSKEFGLKLSTVCRRLREGWPVERLLLQDQRFKI